SRGAPRTSVRAPRAVCHPRERDRGKLRGSARRSPESYRTAGRAGPTTSADRFRVARCSCQSSRALRRCPKTRAPMTAEGYGGSYSCIAWRLLALVQSVCQRLERRGGGPQSANPVQSRRVEAAKEFASAARDPVTAGD